MVYKCIPYLYQYVYSINKRIKNMNNEFYAQIDNDGFVINVIQGNPEGRFESSIIWYPCEYNVKIGDRLNKTNNGLEYSELELTLEQEKQQALEVIKNIYRVQMSMLTKDYDQYEIATWPIQVREAERIMSGKMTMHDAPCLYGIATKRGLDIKTLAERVLRNEYLFSYASGLITGERQKYEDQVNGCFSKEGLLVVMKKINKWQSQGSLGQDA